MPSRAVQAARTAASEMLSGAKTWWAASEMLGMDGLLNSGSRKHSSAMSPHGGLSSLGGSCGGDPLGGGQELRSFFLRVGGRWRLLIGLHRRSITRCFSRTFSRFGSDAKGTHEETQLIAKSARFELVAVLPVFLRGKSLPATFSLDPVSIRSVLKIIAW